ncbi:MAG: Rieske 2Fe-2S domain-containing protein [Saprospiraceae bacterium]|nr:Rieske 2Fe-2S domain-containing protein [Saprospiraceae bacterium]
MIRNTATSSLRSPLPGSFYRDEDLFHRVKEEIFLPFWQFAYGPEPRLKALQTRPFTLLADYLDEPMLHTCDAEGVEHLFANVCSHRGTLLVQKAGSCRHIVCPYHGRRFSLEGQCQSQPGLGAVADFPRAEDHLHRPETASWGGLTFARVLPGISFEDWISPLLERVGFLPLETLVHMPERSHTYKVKANWALYVENYLEGLHIPFVHPALREALDLSAYPVETKGHTVLQIGLAKENQPAFDLPAGHPDQGKRIYAWYFWLFPNLMLNFYPWGLSLNLVLPVSPTKTRIQFFTYRFEGQEGGPHTHALHDTELEDESVVESVQKGVRSSLYKPGRLVPAWEDGVLHFHRLLVRHLGL